MDTGALSVAFHLIHPSISFSFIIMSVHVGGGVHRCRSATSMEGSSFFHLYMVLSIKPRSSGLGAAIFTQ